MFPIQLPGEKQRNPLNASTQCGSRASRWWATVQAHRLAPLVAIGSCYLLVSLILRLVLFVAFGLDNNMQPGALIPAVFLGLLNDAVTLSYLLGPLYLILFFMPDRLYRSSAGRLMIAAMGWIASFITLYLAVAQYYFFKEFNARFNLVAVDYLIYPHEVFINIYQSYHVASIFFILAIYATVMVCFYWRWLTTLPQYQMSLRKRAKVAAGYATGVLLLATFVSTHSLDFSANRVVNEIAANGISSFFEALHTNHLDYATYYRTGDRQGLANLLATELAEDTSRSRPALNDLQRVAKGDSHGLGQLNVVVIVEESLGCEHADVCKNGLDIDAAIATATTALTPNLDRLARQGIFFNRAYATGTRTVRGLEAITSSFPPIPSESIIKRPGNDHIATWGKVMQQNGYQTSFLYGGYSLFDNMKAFYSGNDFTVRDRSNIEHPRFANIWGVSDQDLFEYAKTYFDQQAESGTPFFAIIMTTSNHSPYTFPEGVEGVRAHGGGRLDGVRYADYALGEFFKSASSAPWYKQTLFVVVADHGARVYGSAKIPLRSYEIPLLIMAPGHLEPQQVASPVSQIDIAPTVMGILGLSYTAPFFGQNVFAERDAAKVLLFNHNHDVALYQNGRLAVLGLRNAVHTYKYQLGDDRIEETRGEDSIVDLAVAYYQTAYTLFMQHAYL